MMVQQTTPLKFALIAGEHSGDILGADLIQALKQRHLSFNTLPKRRFFGGDHIGHQL